MSDTIKATPATPTTTAATPASQPAPETPKPAYSALRAAIGIPPAKVEKEDPKPKEAPKPKAEALKEEPKPEGEASAAKTEETQKPEKTVKRVPKPQQTVRVEGADELREAAKTLKDVTASMRKVSEKKDDEPKLELPEDIDVEELHALEELDPKKFKGLEAKARKFWGKGGQEEQYIAEWKKANPGQQFDSAAPEHAEFYDKNEPFVTDAERKAAQRHIGAKIATTKAEEAARKVTEPVQRELARERAVKAAEPQRSTWEQTVLKASVESADPEAKGIEFSKLADEHPLLHGVVTQIHESVKPAIDELFALKNGAPFDAKNPVHASIMGVAEHMQRQILQMPEENREIPILGKGGKITGYKAFVPMHVFRDMSAEDQATHWTVSEDTILEAIQNDMKATVAQNFKAEADKIAKFGGTVKRKNAPKPAEKKSDEPQEQADDSDAESRSVEAGASAPTPTPKSEESDESKKKYPSLRKAFGIG